MITSAPGAYWSTGTKLTTVTSGTANVTVGSQMQNWEGMGGAFNEMGWNVISMLSTSDQATLMDDLFGADAANFIIGRIPMGASDYALQRYTDDEVAAGQTDMNLASFSITQDQKLLIPYVKAAMAVNSKIRFWASPWTPPTWMKTTTGSITNSPNGPTSCANMGNSPFNGGCMMNTPAILSTYAQYFVKWIQAYQALNINIESVSPQNEPNFSQGYPSCLWTAALFDSFVANNLGPALNTAKLNTSVMMGTMSNSNTQADPNVVTVTMGDATAKGFIKVLGYQWGLISSVAGDKTKYSPLPIWQTEHQAGNYPFGNALATQLGETFNMTKAPNDQGYGVESWELIRMWVNNGVTSYSAWNMVLDTIGLGIDTVRVWPQDSLITVDTSTKKFNLTPAYYVFRHISQFAQPGGHVMGTTTANGLEALAFKNPDNSELAVIFNSGAAQMVTVSINGKMVQFQIPANGWASVVE